MRADARRFNVVACGRRWGKTTMGTEVVLEPALAGYPTAWFSPTYKMLSEVWRDLRNTLLPVVRRVSEQEHRLELVTGGVVDMWSLDAADTARGRKYKRVVVDEAAMDPTLLTDWQNVIRPTLTDLIGDAWFLSTPNGLNGFHALYQQGQDAEQRDWRSWQSPTLDNPFISPAEIEDARRDLPEAAFAQEYLAQFLSDSGSIFRKVLDAATATPEPRIDGHTYVIGVDWAKQTDFSVFSVLDATTRRQVAMDRSNRVDYVVQMERLQALCDAYKPTLIVAEKNSIGEPLIEHLLRRRLPVAGWTATNASKAAAVEALSLALERGNITLLDDKTQTGELLAYQGERLPSGMTRYAAPAGMHDDTVVALMLAWLGGLQEYRSRGRVSSFEVQV